MLLQDANSETVAARCADLLAAAGDMIKAVAEAANGKGYKLSGEHCSEQGG